MSRSGAFRILVAIALLVVVLVTRKEILARRPGTTETVPAPGTVRAVTPGSATAPPGTAEALAQAREVVRRSEVEGDPDVQLVCVLSPALENGHGYLAIGGHSGMVGRNVEVWGGKAYVPYVFPKPRPDGKPVDAFPREGWLAIDGYGPTKVAWNEVPSLDAALGAGSGSGAEEPSTEKAHCVAPGSSNDAPATVELPAGVAAVSGTVHSQATLGTTVKGAWVEGCGNRVIVEDDGSFYMEVVNEACTLQAFRQPSAKRAKSPPVDVTPTPGKDLVVDLLIAG